MDLSVFKKLYFKKRLIFILPISDRNMFFKRFLVPLSSHKLHKNVIILLENFAHHTHLVALYLKENPQRDILMPVQLFSLIVILFHTL